MLDVVSDQADELIAATSVIERIPFLTRDNDAGGYILVFVGHLFAKKKNCIAD